MALMLPVHLGATAAAARDAMRPGVLKYYQNIRTVFAQIPASYGEHLPRLKMIEETLGYPVRSGSSAFKLQLALKLLPLTASTTRS